MLLIDVLPEFCNRLIEELKNQNKEFYVDQIPRLRIVGRCGCKEIGCATLNLEFDGGQSEINKHLFKKLICNSFEVDNMKSMVVLDIDNLDQICSIEIIDREDLSVILDRANIHFGFKEISV